MATSPEQVVVCILCLHGFCAWELDYTSTNNRVGPQSGFVSGLNLKSSSSRRRRKCRLARLEQMGSKPGHALIKTAINSRHQSFFEGNCHTDVFSYECMDGSVLRPIAAGDTSDICKKSRIALDGPKRQFELY